MDNDWIKKFCEGKGKRFGGKQCPSYEQSTRECSLLRQARFRDVFEKGHCQPEIIKIIVQGILKGYKDLVNPKEYVDSVTFEVQHAILSKEKPLEKGAALPVLMGYISTTARRKIHKILKKEGHLPKYPCRNCVYLSSAKSHTCQREILITSKGEIKNPYYEKKMRSPRSSKKNPLKDGEFEAPEKCDGFVPPQVTEFPEEIQSGHIPQVLEIDIISENLSKRANQAESRRKMFEYKRQELVFYEFIRYLQQTGQVPSKRWRIQIARKFGVSEKAIERDLNDLTEYIKSMSYNG